MARVEVMLAAAVAILVALAAFELSPPARAVRGAAPVPAVSVTGSPATVPGTEPVAAYVTQILARPLFTEGRRPATVSSSPAAAAQAEKPPRLSGILVAGNEKRAIFENNGKATVGVVGGQVGAYRILAITPLRVTLQGPGGTLALGLAYGPAASGVPAPTTPSIIDQLNTGGAPPPGMPKTPTFQEMMANLPKTMPPMLNGIPLNDTRTAQ